MARIYGILASVEEELNLTLEKIESIIAIIIFHFVLNISSVLLQTEQFAKCIVTAVLLVLSGIVVWRDKRFFVEKQPQLFELAIKTDIAHSVPH
jgi:hypothetical protein